MSLLVIFDLDGTLLYTLEDLTDSVNFALIKNGQKTKSVNEIKSCVGNGVEKLIERVVPDGKNNPNYQTILNDFKSHYKNNLFNKTKVYDGVLDVLNKLKDKSYKITILSNKFDSAVKELANRYFKNLIDFAIGVNDDILPKPSDTGVNMLMDRFNVKNKDCCIIGDSETDILTSLNSDIDCISVTWGYRDRSCLIKNGAKKIIDSPSELLNIL